MILLGGGGVGMGGMGPLLLFGLVVAAVVLAVLAMRAVGQAVVEALRRRRSAGRR